MSNEITYATQILLRNGTLADQFASGSKTANQTTAKLVRNVMTVSFVNTFTPILAGGIKSWFGIATSSDGLKLLAAVYSGYLYRSIDGGATWTEDPGSAGSKNWEAVASSADGVNLLAAEYGGNIWQSTDSGGSWAALAGAGVKNWTGVASSSDGVKLAACADGSDIFTSTNSGGAWTDQAGSGSKPWRGIASSADGTKLIACVDADVIYRSTNSGVAWGALSSGTTGWLGVASSSDGVTLFGNNIYNIAKSVNSGTTWTWPTDYSGAGFRQLACIPDASKLFAAIGGGGYILETALNGTLMDLGGVTNPGFMVVQNLSVIDPLLPLVTYDVDIGVIEDGVFRPTIRVASGDVEQFKWSPSAASNPYARSVTGSAELFYIIYST